MSRRPSMPAWISSWCSSGPKLARLSISASSRHIRTSFVSAATWSARVWRRVVVSETSSSSPVVKMPWWSSRSRWAGSIRVSSSIGGTGRVGLHGQVRVGSNDAMRGYPSRGRGPPQGPPRRQSMESRMHLAAAHRPPRLGAGHDPRHRHGHRGRRLWRVDRAGRDLRRLRRLRHRAARAALVRFLRGRAGTSPRTLPLGCAPATPSRSRRTSSPGRSGPRCCSSPGRS